MGGLGRPPSWMFLGWEQECKVKMIPMGTQQTAKLTVEVPGRFDASSTTVVIT